MKSTFLTTQEDQPSLPKWLSACSSHICGDEVLWETLITLVNTSSAHHDPDHWTPFSSPIVLTAVPMTQYHMSSISPPPRWTSAGGTMHVCCTLISARHLTHNTIVPLRLVAKLRDIGLSSSLCFWVLNFQVMKIGKCTSSNRTLNSGAPKAAS